MNYLHGGILCINSTQISSHDILMNSIAPVSDSDKGGLAHKILPPPPIIGQYLTEQKIAAGSWEPAVRFRIFKYFPMIRSASHNSLHLPMENPLPKSL